MHFKVTVSRTTCAEATFLVNAVSEHEAENKAIELSGNHIFSSRDAERVIEEFSSVPVDRETAMLILARNSGFHSLLYPAGDGNALKRQKVLAALCPELRGKNGLVPRRNATVTKYHDAIVKAFGTTDELEIIDQLKDIVAAIPLPGN